MSIKTELHKMFEDNEYDSLSCARIMTWGCAIIGTILLVLYFFGIGTNAEAAYTLIGLGIGGGTIKSISSQFVQTKETTEK